ncbi:MAG: cob(I)yrinic acid a,c-diamide adenosyltransferase [Gammaproteobacteria bacterium]|nr:cob(I)yrinic acid a,c-diamide adenosyltransferase [Gammaproteobacteria bacterium]
MGNSEKEQRYQNRMQRKKIVVDAAINHADRDKGLVVVLTGNGKGKSSSAFGMVTRALGHSMKVGVAQFIKGCSDTGEEAFFRNQPNVTWHVLGEGFTWDTQNLSQDIETAKQGWTVVQEMLKDESLSLIVLDELTYPLKYGWLEMDSVLSDISNRPPMQHLIITGRAAPKALCEVADTVTELSEIKHAFRNGVRAQKGVDL